MLRVHWSVLALSSLGAVAPAMAADYPDLRPAYPDQWEQSEDSLRFEAGVRYWYSIGQHNLSVGTDTETINTRTSSGEVFVRIDDDYTRTYVEATGGYGVGHDGDYSVNGAPALSLPAARLGYVGADFGWMPFGNEAGGVGLLAGYQYSNDSPDTGRANFTVAETSSDIAYSDQTGDWSVGFDSETNNFYIHALRLGATGRVDLGAFDLTGELVGTPYAWVNGTYGSYAAGPFGDAGGQTTLQASATAINGFGYGGSAKAMVGFHPTENLTIRLGGRASYLQGAYDATFDTATITEPQPIDGAAPGEPQFTAPTLTKQTYIIDNNPFSLLRYGALFELTGRF